MYIYIYRKLYEINKNFEHSKMNAKNQIQLARKVQAAQASPNSNLYEFVEEYGWHMAQQC